MSLKTPDKARSLLCIMKQVRGILRSQRYDTILLRVLWLPDALAEMSASPHGGSGNRQHPETPASTVLGVQAPALVPTSQADPLQPQLRGVGGEGNELSLSSDTLVLILSVSCCLLTGDRWLITQLGTAH